MKAMILAAGRGKRMRPLTDTVPKPLLSVGGKPLIVWQIERLVKAGFDDLVINHAWLGSQLEEAIADGSHRDSRWDAHIAWSREAVALETAGGIVTALPLLEDSARDQPFVVVSADIHTDFDYARLVDVVEAIRIGYPRRAAHLVLTDNPPWHPRGDMALDGTDDAGLIARQGEPRYTYANIGVFHPRVFDDLPAHMPLSLFPWAYALVDAKRVTGEIFHGAWDNVGTPEQLHALDRRLHREGIAHG